MSLRLRPAVPLDAGAAGDILWRHQADTDWLPDLWSAAQTIGFCGRMIERGWVTVAERQGRVQGFLARDDSEICALYLAPSVRGQGLGRRLMDHAKLSVTRLWLCTHEANARARRFYARAGFVAVAHGDGTGNDEGLPEIRYVWTKEPTP